MDKLLTPKDVEAKTGTSTNTLAYWRHIGDVGPKYAKFGRRVVYRESDVDAWIEAQFAKADARSIR